MTLSANTLLDNRLPWAIEFHSAWMLVRVEMFFLALEET
jgi:hypothetical protein